MHDVGGSSGHINKTLAAMQEAAIDKAAEMDVNQEETKEDVQAALKEAVNPFAKKKTDRKKLETRSPRVTKLMQSSGQLGESEAAKQSIRQKAAEYQSRNGELKSKVLELLREYVKPDDTPEEILAKVLEFYEDVSLADEALEFLEETSEGQMNVHIQEAKEELNANKKREVAAGRNVGNFAREYSDEKLGSPSDLRDLYRDITGNPQDAQALFQELSSKYGFTDLKKVIQFLFHSLGADLRSKGPSIPPGLLHNLLKESRSLQAILGVYRFFEDRMGLIELQFYDNHLEMPSQLNFEELSKLFMQFVGERYLTPDRVISGAARLGIEKWIMAKIIAFSALRDAIRQVSLNQVYRSVQHRDELLATIIQALEALEEELENLLDQEESRRFDRDDDDEDEEED